MILKFKQLARDSFIYSIGSIVSRIVGFFLIPVYTRIFTPDDYGTIELLLTFNGLLLTILVLGTDSALTRYFYERGDLIHRRDVVSTTFWFRLIWGAGIVTICMLAASVFNRFLLEDAVPNSYFYLIFAATLFGVVFDCLTVVYRLLLRPGAFLAITLVQSIFSAALILLLVAYFKLGIQGYLTGYALSSLAFIPVAVIFLKEYISFRFSLPLLKKLLTFGIPLLPTGIAIWIMSFTDRYFLTQYTSLAEVGIYAAGSKFGMAIALITGAFRLAWTPLALSVSKEPDVKSFYRNVAELYFAGGSFLALLLTGFSKLIMMIMTQPDYYAGYTVIGIIAYCAVFYGFYTLSTLGIWLGEKTIFATLAIAASAAINIGLNIIFIPVWGIIGAAIATLISYICGNTIAFYFGEKYHPFGFKFLRLGAILIITCTGIAVQLSVLGSDLPLHAQYLIILLCWISTGLLLVFGIIGKSRIGFVTIALSNYIRKRINT